MENNQPRKKNAGVTALIAMLLIITTLASCIGLYAWAKYITNQNGRATVDVAKWNFNLSLRAGQNTVTTPTQTLDLATTTYQNLANDRIAPGTSGEFDIVINTQGTEVSLNYDVTIAITDCPRNITFSRQQGTDASTLETVSAGGTDTFARTIHFSKYVPVANASGEFVEKIKWNWPYEGGNDAWDTADQGKTTKLAITVVGTEVLSDPNAGGNQGNQPAANSVQGRAQAGNIQPGDWVNYNPGTLTTASIKLPEGAKIEGSKLASVGLPSGASINGTIDASESGNWKVLDVNQTTGEVLIIPTKYSSTSLLLSRMDGYNNAITALNNVASIYLNPTYATSARSLTVEDVNNRENHTPNGDSAEYTWNHRYGMNPTTLDITYTGSDSTTPSQTYTSTATTGYYKYSTNIFSNMSCWLASRCVGLDSDGCYFYVRNVRGGSVDYGYLFSVNSNGYAGGRDNSYPVVPVVSLKSNVQIEKDENDVWILDGDATYHNSDFGLPEPATGTATATE